MVEAHISSTLALINNPSRLIGVPLSGNKVNTIRGRVKFRAGEQMPMFAFNWKGVEQGRIHGYPSRVRQGPYLRSLDHLGRSSEAKDRKNPQKK